MTIASYADLQTAVAGWLHRADLTAIIPDLITLAEKRINREIRCADMETAYTGTIASGVIAVPSDFMAWKVVYINASPVGVLEPKTLEWLITNYPTRSADSQPKFIARNASNFEFGPYPDSTYAVKGTYYKKLTAVSSSWNALATTYPDLYLMATLCEATPYIKNDQRTPIWEAKYNAIRESINAEAKGADISGGPIRVTAG